MTNQINMRGLDNPMGHFVLVPFMAQGHMIPMIDLAHLLADRGLLVTFITTPLNASRIRPTINRAQDKGLLIHFVELPFPCKEVGLPEGCENVDIVPSGDLVLNFFEGMTLLGKPLELYLRKQDPYPSCIISDSCHHWTQEVAHNLQIPRISFYSIRSFTLLCLHNIFQYKVYDRITNEHEPFIVPGLPQKIVVTKAQAPGFFTAPGYEEIDEKVKEAELAADGIVMNTFEFLEPVYIENYTKAMGKKVWAVGPFFLHGNKDSADMTARGNKASIDINRCLNWLDSMKPRSVVYVSFGSLTIMSTSQLMEIGLGLEASNHPFIWVIKDCEYSPEVEEWLSQGFKERTGSRGLIIKGWAPQMMILSHPAVGGFMTHCGWNSTLEGLCAGVPMITWPSFADQFLNERLIVDVARIGLSVGVKEPGAWTMDVLNQHIFANKVQVERAVRNVMDEGEEAEERRNRVKELGEKAREAMEEGGSSYANMTGLIQQFSLKHNKNVEGI